MGEGPNIAQPGAHPHDVCECGDYRRQHSHGTGACIFNRPTGQGHHGAPDCQKFRMAVRASVAEATNG